MTELVVGQQKITKLIGALLLSGKIPSLKPLCSTTWFACRSDPAAILQTMRDVGGRIRLSASDLANHLGCRQLTEFDRLTALRQLEPPIWRDPALEVLQQRGFEHEEKYLEILRQGGRDVTVIKAEEGQSAFELTKVAMQDGAEVIVQAVLEREQWYGRADVLLRVSKPSALGAWSYEVVDTKLARDTKAGTILQLCMYSEVVAEIQGISPEHMHVVSPGDDLTPETFRVGDYLAYYRLVRGRLEKSVKPGGVQGLYPEPVPQCDICRWWKACDTQRRADDHLSLVAGISRLQRRELESRGTTTLTALAELPLPLEWRPSRGAADSYVRVREQARVQLEGRKSGKAIYELLDCEPGLGLARLPQPSVGDVFFDIEGDAFVGDSGLEYLLGFVVIVDGESSFDGYWAETAVEEKLSFERFIDMLMQRWESDPGMHVYHYAPYEPGAMKRLMGRFGTREDEVDRLLRAGVFVDLYGVAKQSVRASVERYSIKDLEVFYGFERQVVLREASAHLRLMERALELGARENITDEVRETVRKYNEDDCVSTWRLRDWLESLRAQLVANGEGIVRPETGDGVASEKVDEHRQRTLLLMARLEDGLCDDEEQWSAAQRGRWLLAQVLEWHRRESKVPWWEYFRMQSLTDEDFLYENGAVSGLEFVETVGGTAKCPIHRYQYPKQDTDLLDDDSLVAKGDLKIGTLVTIDQAARTLDIKKTGESQGIHPTAVFEHSIVNTRVLAEALYRVGTWVADNGIDSDGPYRAGRDLLLRKPPRLCSGSVGLWQEGEDALGAARRLGLELEAGVLPVQGPPGAGKTFTGARMICELVKAGKKVGITAVSHKVIRNLLEAVAEAAEEQEQFVRCMEKVGGKANKNSRPIRESDKNGEVLRALARGSVDVVGGTGWLWAREDAQGAVDVLFVDEAGQMSLPDVVAVSQGATSIVLLGDPQQLEQPIQGSHPEGTSVSALEHLLGREKTMSADRGLFLGETWRLHPSICQMTSELFYEGRLESRKELQAQALVGTGGFDGAGLWFVPVDHVGNQNSCSEETEQVARLVEMLLAGEWNDAKGAKKPLGLEDILIVAPYNAQVADLVERIAGARVGTVDKFQGQEAPVVIYSMTTSSPEEAPRGMEFLYSLNRLNVATSRARCACILVASPALFESDCRTPRQIQLANAFCRYLELATIVADEI